MWKLIFFILTILNIGCIFLPNSKWEISLNSFSAGICLIIFLWILIDEKKEHKNNNDPNP